MLEERTQSTNDTSDNFSYVTANINGFSETDTNTIKLPPVIIYTDGSCISNYASGIGIYFGPNHPLNKSKTIYNREHNSGLAEIIAVKTALKSLQKWNLYKGEYVILRTDFLPLIHAMNNDGFNGRFHEEYLKLKRLANKFPHGVQFEHVFAHEGEQGNEEANNLARQATADARLARSRSAPPFRDVSCDLQYLKSRRSRSRCRSKSRSRSRNPRFSRDSLKHRRSRSAYIPGKYSRRRR